MCYTVIPTDKFERDIEYYVKKKKYRHIGSDIKKVTDKLQMGNLVGDDIPGLEFDLSSHTYRVRVANSDMNAGKKDGYRIIYYVIKDDKEIYLLTIYSKKDSYIPNNFDILKLLNEYCINAKGQE